MIKLYDYELSGDCYKVRLLLDLLRQPYERIDLDVYPGCEHKAPWFLAINPLGELPVLDDAFVLRDAHAILVYLARKYDATGAWCPVDAEALGNITEWLGVAQNLAATAGAARLHDTIFYEADIDRCRDGAHRLLRLLDEHLWFAEQEGRDWLCSRGHPTIADVACFPDVMLCEEGGISRLPYPAVRRWCDRLKRTAHFSTMPGIFPARTDASPLDMKSLGQ